MKKITTTEQPPPLQASKWLKSQVLIDAEEMSALFDALGEFSLYLAGCVTLEGEGEFARHDFLQLYHDYISSLREGREPDVGRYRTQFSAIMTVTDEVLYSIALAGGKQLIRVGRPAVQMQYHTMDYSQTDGKFRPMVLGHDSMSWGIQFSYPQLFQDPETHQIQTVDVSDQFPNTQLFRLLQKWLRAHTIPTPFIVNGVAINVPMRLGKRCLPWVNNHPHLIAKGIKVDAG